MKRDAKKTSPANRVMRQMTPAERARWKKAAAEAENSESKAAGRRVMQAHEAGRAALRDAFKILRAERVMARPLFSPPKSTDAVGTTLEADLFDIWNWEEIDGGTQRPGSV